MQTHHSCYALSAVINLLSYSYCWIAFRVNAEKEGFVLAGLDANGNFNAHKLAEVIVEVVDKADSKPLQVSFLNCMSFTLN
jgi:hypothetical protein